MNLALEASSVACWWASYKTISAKDDVIMACLGGFTSGLIVSGICLPRPKVRLFPESLQERNAIFKSAYRPTVIRLGLGHACFFTVYEGMQKSVKTARSRLGVEKRDWQDIVNDFWIGGLSGWCFRATSLSFPMGTSPLAVPLTLKLMLQTFLKTGCATVGLETLDYTIKGRLPAA
jgi:hypothetical protein